MRDDLSNKEMDEAEEAVRRDEENIFSILKTSGPERALHALDRFNELYRYSGRRAFSIFGKSPERLVRIEDPSNGTYGQEAFIEATVTLDGRTELKRRVRLVLSDNYDILIDLMNS